MHPGGNVHLQHKPPAFWRSCAPQCQCQVWCTWHPRQGSNGIDVWHQSWNETWNLFLIIWKYILYCKLSAHIIFQSFKTKRYIKHYWTCCFDSWGMGFFRWSSFAQKNGPNAWPRTHPTPFAGPGPWSTTVNPIRFIWCFPRRHIYLRQNLNHVRSSSPHPKKNVGTKKRLRPEATKKINTQKNCPKFLVAPSTAGRCWDPQLRSLPSHCCAWETASGWAVQHWCEQNMVFK